MLVLIHTTRSHGYDLCLAATRRMYSLEFIIKILYKVHSLKPKACIRYQPWEGNLNVISYIIDQMRTMLVPDPQGRTLGDQDLEGGHGCQTFDQPPFS